MDVQIIIVALITTLGSGTGILAVIFTRKMDAQRKATEAQTLQNALVGRLRVSMEGLEDHHSKAHNEFLEYLGGAYVRGNDKETVRAHLERLKNKADDIESSIATLRKAITDVYAHRIGESDVDRIINNAESK